MIELKNVSKYYSTEGNVTLGLRNINLKFNKNEIVAIVGDSGSGKSTLLNVICGIDSYEEGEIYFNGNETSYFNQNDMDMFRKDNVGFIFQNYNIIDSYTVLDNVILPLILNGYNHKDAKKRAIELINSVGLSERLSNKGAELSGGEKQRCVIARALASDCQILACDEPTGNLDSKSSKEIIDIIKSVSKDKLVLIVTHNYDEVKDIVTRTIKVSDGEIVEDYQKAEIVEEDHASNNVDNKQMKKRDVLFLALKNLLSTPKKSLFIYIVFFIMSLVALYLYLSCVASSQVCEFNPDNAFKNYEYNRLIAFNYDHSEIIDKDFSNIEGEYYENAFYEDLLFTINLEKDTMLRDLSISSTYSRYQIQYEHLIGTTTRQGEYIYIVVPENELDRYSLLIKDYVGGYVTIKNSKYKFIGVGYSSYQEEPVILSNVNLEDVVKSMVLRTYISLNITFPTLKENIKVTRTYQNVQKPTLYLPAYYMDYIGEIDYNFIINNLYPMSQPGEIEYSFTPGKADFYFSLPTNYVPEVEGVYEYIIYADKPNEAVNQLKKLGLTVVRPSVEFSEISQNQLLYLAYVAISTVIVAVLSFVSYAILFKVYVSKNKDYTIFRTLGVSRKNMTNMVRMEIVILSILASIFALVLTYVLYYMYELELLNVVAYNELSVMILYFLVMILFAFFLANRFNKKIFKFSIQTTLKREDAKND